MKVNCRPVRLTSVFRSDFDCAQCEKAWRLHKKALRLEKKFKRLGANEKVRPLVRRAHWLRVKAAQILYEDRENHVDTSERQCALTILNGSAERQRQFGCWNCRQTLYASWSRYSESIFCRHCFATMYGQWLTGKMTDEDVKKFYDDKQKEPYMANGLWEDYRWSKKEKDMVRRKKENG